MTEVFPPEILQEIVNHQPLDEMLRNRVVDKRFNSAITSILRQPKYGFTDDADADNMSEQTDYQVLPDTDSEDESNESVESYRDQLQKIRNALRYNDLMGFLPDGVRTKEAAELQTFHHTQRVLHYLKGDMAVLGSWVGEHLYRSSLAGDNNEPVDSFHHPDLTNPYPLSIESPELAITGALEQLRVTSYKPFKRFSGGLFDVAKQGQVAHVVQFIRNYFTTIRSSHCLQVLAEQPDDPTYLVWANVIAAQDPSRVYYFLANVMIFHTIPNVIVALLIYGHQKFVESFLQSVQEIFANELPTIKGLASQVNYYDWAVLIAAYTKIANQELFIQNIMAKHELSKPLLVGCPLGTGFAFDWRETLARLFNVPFQFIFNNPSCELKYGQ
ncbi:hypothetical protein H4R35_006701 [Dimargaris xerosporica]|nr:hypothetical protein H4R35_006701 [Dimargaris xerosporica]